VVAGSVDQLARLVLRTQDDRADCISLYEHNLHAKKRRASDSSRSPFSRVIDLQQNGWFPDRPIPRGLTKVAALRGECEKKRRAYSRRCIFSARAS
jgi:hypothetical protein